MSILKELYPSFSKFYTRNQQKRQNNRKNLLPYYAVLIWWLLYCLGVSILAILVGFSVILFSEPYKKPKYPSSKYKKVVKPGLFYDNVEYHER